MAVMPRVEQPKIEIERKIGNTTYIVNGFFASQGITVSTRICVRSSCITRISKANILKISASGK